MTEKHVKGARREAGENAQASRSRLEEAAAADSQRGVLLHMREWLDALIIAFVLAMFIRTFVVELFKIPSGSMTPTLLGDWVAEGVALDEDNREATYLFIRDRGADTAQVFRKDRNGHFMSEGPGRPIYTLTTSQQDLLRSRLHLEEHRIFVNKFAYWFKKPKRADIVVFRVPFTKEGYWYRRGDYRYPVKPYDRNQGVYVKRAVAFDGETVSIAADGQLEINGKVATEPDIFKALRYVPIPEDQPYKVTVPEGEVFAFGDNTRNSLDSRYWGGIPYENLRGRAFFRYWPWRKMRFLD